MDPSQPPPPMSPEPTGLFSSEPGLEPPAAPVPTQEQKRDAEMLVVKVLMDLKDAADTAADTFRKQGDEVAKYGFASNFDFLYGDVDGIDPEDLFFKACVNRASEFIDVMGPRLYPSNPVASVQSEEWTTVWTRKRHVLEARYANWSLKEGNTQSHARRAVDQACIYGRGVLWPVLNPTKNMVMLVWEDIKNVGIDPQARILEEARYFIRRRLKPRFDLYKRFPEKKREIRKLKRCSDNKVSGPASDLVEHYELYIIPSLSVYNSVLKDLAASAVEDPEEETLDGSEPQALVNIPDSPTKYIFADGCLLGVEPWEFPTFKDDLPPCAFIDTTTPAPGTLWPRSPLLPGLGHLKALNWIYTLYLSKMKTTVRTPLVAVEYNGQGIPDDQLVRLIHGPDLDVIKVKINGEPLPLTSLLQTMNFQTGVEELERFVRIVGVEFERSTGLYEVLHTGQTVTQPRSAAEIQSRDDKTLSRVNEMSSKVQEGMTLGIRLVLLGARYLQGPEDLGRIFGPDAAVWGNIAPPEIVEQERQMRQMQLQQAMQQQQAAMGGMGTPLPPPPDIAQIDEQMGPEQYIDFDQWLAEADRGIEAGSMRRVDYQMQIDNLNVAMNQLGPGMANLPGGPLFMAALAREFAKIHRLSPDLVDAANKAYAITEQMVMNPPPVEGKEPPK